MVGKIDTSRFLARRGGAPAGHFRQIAIPIVTVNHCRVCHTTGTGYDSRRNHGATDMSRVIDRS